MRDPVLSDDSGYFVSGVDSSVGFVVICKYLFSSPATSQCQKITSFRLYDYGTLKLSDNSLYLVGSDIATPWSLLFYKMTFGSTTPTWALKIYCLNPSTGCSIASSETVVISSTIYSFFVYGVSTTTYGYSALLDLNTGSVSLRYKSSIICQYIYSLIVSGDYIAVALTCGVGSLLLYNTATNTFNIRSLSSMAFYGVNVEASTGRLVLVGTKTPMGYIGKVSAQFINYHPDFQTASSMTMNSLSAGTEDITANTGQTFGTITSLAVGVQSLLYTNQTVTYVSGVSYTSDVSYQTSSQTYTFSKNGNILITPDISCSFSGSTSITYSLASYNGNAISSWVAISSSTGQLTITTPNPAVNTDYPFYISSTISGVTDSVNKLITITISSCTVSNCQVCQATNIAICTACNSGYTLSSNSCSLTLASTNSASTTSPTSPANSSTSNNSTSSSINDNFDLKITAQVSKNLIVASFIASSVSLLISNISMASSVSTIWLMIDQIQLFFLLFLTRAFIPDQIKEVIIGMNFLLNPFDTIYIFNPQFYGDLLDKLYYEVVNPELKYFNIESLSTVYNSFSIVSGGIFIVTLHVIIYFINKWTSKWENDGRCSKLKWVLKFIIKKAYEIMTFAIYIRYILELSQFLIASSISEI